MCEIVSNLQNILEVREQEHRSGRSWVVVVSGESRGDHSSCATLTVFLSMDT